MFFRAILRWWLIPLQHQKVLDDQSVHFCNHEAPISLCWSADDRLTSDIEARVHDDRHSGTLFDATYQLVIAGIRVPMHGLNSSRPIDMGYRWDL